MKVMDIFTHLLIVKSHFANECLSDSGLLSHNTLTSGHNWGSEHDPDSTECSPSSASGGKYIMYTYSVSGIDSNNQVSR